MANKSRVLGVRLDEDIFEKLESIERVTHVEKVTLARAAIMAAIASWETTQKLEFPIRFTVAADLPPGGAASAQGPISGGG